MAALRRFSAGDALPLLAILAVAAGLRAGYLAFAADHGRSAGPVQVQGEDEGLKALVANLKDHHWFGDLAPFADVEEQTAHVAPGYPWLLGLAARLPVDLDPAVRWAQCGLGALTAGLYFLFARRAFRSLSVGTLTGFAAALYPFWVVSTAELNDGVLATFLLAACLFLGARAGQAGGSFTSLLYGLALAGLALTRAALLPFAFVGLLWFLLHCRRQTRGWLLALLAFLGFANGLAPWTLRNLQVFQDVVPIADSAFLHLWMGNNPAATGGPLSERDMLEALARQRGQAPAEVARQLADKPQKERYREFATAAVQEVRANPLGTVRRRISAGLYFFFGERWFKDQQLGQPAAVTLRAAEDPDRPEGSEPAAPPPLAAWVAGNAPLILTASLFGLLLLGVLGWRWTYAWRRESMPAALAVLWVPLPYLLSHAGALSGPRLPLDGVLLCYAAFAVACLVPGVGRGLLHGANEQPAPAPR
jgi:4-amino-4-deoxy-L-arabinose transferase-like glycosyltransferase